MRSLKLLLIFILWSQWGHAQISLSISGAEATMLKNNLLLLAEQFNISAARAAVIQAKIWDQPYLTAEFNAVNPQENKIFDIGNSGQKGIAIQQLIYLGGKKKNEIAFAKSSVSIAELQFEQLIRNLKYQLSQSFYTLHYTTKKILAIENQISKLDTLLFNYNVQEKKGNISLKEVVRLQALVLNLKNDRNTFAKDIIELQQTIGLLTGILEPIVPNISEAELITKYQKITISKDSIVAIALTNNADYLTILRVAESQELFLRWQKSLAVPDITAGAAYDQRGGAFQNQVNLTIGIPLPLWNRNRGNIKIAEAQLQQNELTKKYKKAELERKVEALLKVWAEQQNQLRSINQTVIQNLEIVYEGMVTNFLKRNISLLEFTDFTESYNEAILQINDIKKTCILSGISLNHITNKEIF